MYPFVLYDEVQNCGMWVKKNQ